MNYKILQTQKKSGVKVYDNFLSYIEAHPNVTKIGFEEINILKDFTQQAFDTDTYLISPIYYLLTGRKGLWLYKQEETKVLFCLHPNVNNEILIFPPLKKMIDFNKIENLTKLIAPMNMKSRIVRVKDYAPNIANNNSNTYKFLKVEENVLDWKFPARILDTKKVSDCKGKEFGDLRNNINRAIKKIDHVELIDHTTSFDEIEGLIKQWSENHENEDYTYDDYFTPHDFLVKRITHQKSNLKGYVSKQNGEIKSINIWEEIELNNKKIANSFLAIADLKIRGICEYQCYQMCLILESRGITHVNLGGSETLGLDKFKEKFAPTISIKMHSIKVIANANDVLSKNKSAYEKKAKRA